ncbi:alpha/beta fold hydrolase [Rhodovulum sp. DZ06]|uniref:alpha/beta fold hydrolase n=1 Tax=Rhodovulum sp. DZ06 TaxID=3425126 RepID=UPI003D331A88
MKDGLPPPAEGFETTRYQIDGVDAAVMTIGAGPDLVFLHGTGAFTGFEAARAWAQTHRVIIPFHPGFGASGDAPAIAGIEDMVFHYAALFDALKLDRFALAGFSLGGWIAAEYAAIRPEQVAQLILVAPAGLVSEAAPAPALLDIAPPELPGYLAHDVAKILPLFPAAPDPDFDAALGREVMGYAKLLEAHPQGNPRLAARLPRLTMPTLLVWGGNDRLRPCAQAAEWMAGLPAARLAAIPDTGHLVFEETPAAAAAIPHFLAETDMSMPGDVIAAEAAWEETSWSILGQTYVLKQQGEYSMSWHATFPDGTFAPPHIHPDQDEFVYVLTGEFAIELGGMAKTAGPGDLVVMPRGIPHGLFNRSGATSTCLFWVAPTRDLRALFDDIHEVPDPEEVVRLAALRNVHFLPPAD